MLPILLQSVRPAACGILASTTPLPGGGGILEPHLPTAPPAGMAVAMVRPTSCR